MLRKKSLLLSLLAVVGISFSSRAQEAQDTSYWSLLGNTGLTLNQVNLSNWSAGGENAIGFNLTFDYAADYKKDKQLWNNRIELAYGLNNTKSDGSKKTSDKLYLSSTYGYGIAKNLYLSALTTFQTQFDAGYNYNTDPRTYISNFMSPGYLTIGTGLTWTPKSWFVATFTPTSWRGVFLTSDILSAEGQYGVDPGSHMFTEFGANLQMEAQYEVIKNINVFSRLSLFSDYLLNPQNVDVNWDVQVNMKINKWFSATISTSLIYDDNILIEQADGTKTQKLQFKETLGVGFQMAF
ncbi:MAG: DUF3078 domain-containing protein [Rikenellaceae bacterium]